tara:strand:+ start:161 stop:541 length:381 start_codon:yes stop_codon:yes gene_type:complete
MNFFIRAIVIVVIFAFAKGMFGSVQEKTQKFSKVRTVSFENSEHFKKARKELRLKKWAKPTSQGSLSLENDRLLAEIKKNTEALNQIQSQLHLQEFATQRQNEMLQRQRNIQHWQGISRMMNVLNN